MIQLILCCSDIMAAELQCLIGWRGAYALLYDESKMLHHAYKCSAWVDGVPFTSWPSGLREPVR